MFLFNFFNFFNFFSFFSFFIFSFLLTFTIGAQAVDIVYRNDQRPPEIIFQQGFLPLGENDNILSHVEGESCISGTRNSVFVATTTNYGFAENFGRDVPEGDAFWVYSIRPTDNFYSAYTSLMHAYEDSGHEIFRTTADTFLEQREYMAFFGVASTQIMGAWLYRSNGLGVEPSRLSYTTNPYYIEEHTDVNQNPYPIYYIPTPSSSLHSCERCISSMSSIKKGNDLSIRIIECERLMSTLLVN